MWKIGVTRFGFLSGEGKGPREERTVVELEVMSDGQSHGCVKAQQRGKKFFRLSPFVWNFCS